MLWSRMPAVVPTAVRGGLAVFGVLTVIIAAEMLNRFLGSPLGGGLYNPPPGYHQDRRLPVRKASVIIDVAHGDELVVVLRHLAAAHSLRFRSDQGRFEHTFWMVSIWGPDITLEAYNVDDLAPGNFMLVVGRNGGNGWPPEKIDTLFAELKGRLCGIPGAKFVEPAINILARDVHGPASRLAPGVEWRPDLLPAVECPLPAGPP